MKTSITRRWLAIIALVVTTGGLLTTAVVAGQAASTPAAHAAKIGHVGKGKIVHAQALKKPYVPTKAQKSKRAADMKFLDGLPAPKVGPHPGPNAVAKLSGAQTAMTHTNAPGSFTVFKTNAPNVVCTQCAQSTVNEPDTANSGKHIIQTSNWNIAFTNNGGASAPTWSFINPYALNPSFCCDQTVTYQPNRDRFFLEGLDLGTGSQTGFDIAVSHSASPNSFCIYHFTGASFGATAGDVTDYPKIAYDNNNLFVTWNEYNAAGNAWLFTGLARFPLDALQSCAGFGFNYLTRNDNFTYGLSMGHSSQDTFYWVSDWYTASAGSGTSERIFHWADNSGTYFFNDVGVASYNFSGGSCASQDGVVTNWCSRLDPRWETASIVRGDFLANVNSAFAGDDTLVVTITAGPGGGDPFPYVIYEYFKLHGPSYIQTSATFNNGFAFAYGSCAPDDAGYLGCTASWGGGTGTTHYFPGGIIILQDALSPSQPWAYSFNLFGSGNASAWGDYQVVQPFEPAYSPFITTEWAVNSSGNVVPEVVIWGRGHDLSYGRYKNA